MRALTNFLGSLCFMIHLVCGLKAGLCLYSNADLKIGRNQLILFLAGTFIWGGFPTGLSIFW